MLMGKYTHNLDAKNRLFIPAKHREQLGDTFIITRNVAKCLSVYSLAEWEVYTAKLAGAPATEVRDVILFLYSNAAEVQPDAQGRVLIPAELLEYAGITKSAVVVGAYKHVEIWSEEAWNERNSTENVKLIQQKMIEFGL